MVLLAGWAGSNRRSRLPKDWAKLREQVRARAGGRCEWVDADGRCIRVGNQCDHVIHGDDHSLANLQWLCSFHHAKKSSSEGGSSKRRKVKRLSRAVRPPESHPGIVRLSLHFYAWLRVAPRGLPLPGPFLTASRIGAEIAPGF